MKWEYIPAGQYCCSVRDGTHDTPKPTRTGYKLVTGKHLKKGRIHPEDAYYISEQDYNAVNGRSLVEQWDVLMSMIGTVGESAVVKTPPDYAIKNIALFKCGGSELKGRWLDYYLHSPMGKGHMNGNQKGSSQQFLSLKQLRALPVPVAEEHSGQDVPQIKQTAIELLGKVKSRIAEIDHWTDKPETKATIDILIRDTLWYGLPGCYDEGNIARCRQQIYEYVYTRYKHIG